MTDSEFAKWERIRQKGAVRFVMLWGAAIYGGGVFLYRLAQVHFTATEGIRAGLALDQLVWSVVGGVFFGVGMWLIFEWRYKGAVARRRSRP
ncbi:MAG: hypothetical protein WCK28_04990 [Burkholderiales bacterium]|jgi:hypothetical protein